MTQATTSDLAAAATQTAERSREGVAWVTTPSNAQRVGDPRELSYRLRQASWRANKLARAASRKLSVATFGVSQAGKSYLVSVLASPPGGRLATELDGKVYDFLESINPPGGRESTGLVTRMTTDPTNAPKGFPVSLRLLTQTELVKILANSFYLDFDPERFEGALPPDAGAIRNRVDELRGRARPGPVERLSEDDVFDLMEYFQSQFPTRNRLFNSNNYWRDALDLAPRLEGRDRSRLWSLLWHDYEPFTKLYNDLYQGLKQLDFQSEAFADLDALVPRERSIIDVSVVDKLGTDENDKVRLMSGGSTSIVGLPRSMVAALTAELRISVKERPPELFQKADLLDFPGARSRLGIKRLEDAGKNEKGESTGNPLRELLLRGKVAYLFEGYTAENEISALLLCVPDSVQEVRGLSDMVQTWVHNTLGATPDARLRQKCGLFLVLTKMDREFEQKGGVKDKEKDWGIRIDSSLIKNFRGDWVGNWDGRPFRNLFWLRNPTVRDTRVMAEGPDKRESGVAEAFKERYRDLHDTFVACEPVRRHFDNPDEAWTEAFSPNDGGISYIVRKLTPICDPETKVSQIKNQLVVLRANIVRELERFYVSGDLQARIAQRLDVGNKIMERLYDDASPARLGSLLRSLQLDSGDLAAHLYGAFVHGAVAEPAADGTEASAAITPAAPSQPSRVGRARPGAPAATSAPPPSNTPAAPQAASSGRSTWERRAAEEVLRCWERTMSEVLDNAQLLRDLRIDRELLGEITADMLALARRTDLQGNIEKAIGKIAHTEQNEQRIAKGAVIGERHVNRLVSKMGFDTMPVDQRPTVGIDGVTRPVFAPRPTTYGTEGWGSGPPEFFEQFFDDWANAFYKVIEDNANSMAGMTVNSEQNGRLGRILTDLRVPV